MLNVRKFIAQGTQKGVRRSERRYVTISALCIIDSKANSFKKMIKNHISAQFLPMQRRILSHCNMHLYQYPNSSELADILAVYTARYTKLRTQGGTKEQFDTCRQAIEFLMAEIQARKTNEETNLPVEEKHLKTN